ncbi:MULTISPECIES: Zn-ribbon domain-containing OB-fold protein [unclassified Phenylobacterium]|uniref:Zn-ribbon domain-containing OB-fold protein n=1 Tax=unclassified Phenylobacterium TaxID=2640670 RepID=UPI0009E7141E|nr:MULTISPECIES: OB-fold domain-containing protein [unclassified Phenylobacterium]
MGAPSIIPYASDRETGAFFEAAAQGRLVYKACDDCQHALHPPTDHCPHCGGWNTAWRDARGTGKLHTWTAVMHQIHPDYPAPYTLVVVELDEAPEVRLVGRLDGEPDLTAGQPMEVWFETLGDGPTLPQWKPAT